MSGGGREQKKERETRPATDEGMHSVAQQQRAGMVSGSMAKGGIGITASPGQDRSAVNDEITCPDEPRSQSIDNGEHEEGFMQRGSGGMATFALLGFARNTGLSLFVQWHSTSQGQSRPTLQPVVHILIRQAP